MKCSLNKSFNNKKTQLSGKYVTLIESKTPWYKSKELTKKNIKKKKKYPHKCKCDNYLNLEECHCKLEHMTNKKNEYNKNKPKNNIIINNKDNKISKINKINKTNEINQIKYYETKKKKINKNIIKLILLILFTIIIVNIIIK